MWRSFRICCWWFSRRLAILCWRMDGFCAVSSVDMVLLWTWRCWCTLWNCSFRLGTVLHSAVELSINSFQGWISSLETTSWGCFAPTPSVTSIARIIPLLVYAWISTRGWYWDSRQAKTSFASSRDGGNRACVVLRQPMCVGQTAVVRGSFFQCQFPPKGGPQSAVAELKKRLPLTNRDLKRMGKTAKR